MIHPTYILYYYDKVVNNIHQSNFVLIDAELFFKNMSTVKPAHAVTSIKQSLVLIFIVLS